MAQIAIRGGTVIDGTGSERRRADVGITDGRISEIGPNVRGDREIDATGRFVTPGFVDLHTHYDPQVTWDPYLTPSCYHGVTTVIAGSCGYSIAPTKAADRASLVRTLDKVEDMRVPTLEAGVPWNFETYPEYLQAQARRGLAINFGGYVGHTPIRLYVMGQDAYERHATSEEIAQMKAIAAESIRGGAIGISTDRAGFHLGDGGRPVPSIAASQDETEALLMVAGEIGRGVVHVAPGENYKWVYDFQRRLGRRLNWSSILTYPATVTRGTYRDKLADHLAGRGGGADVWVQVTCRPIAQQLVMVEPAAFYNMAAFKEFVALPHAERPALMADPGWRERARADIDRLGLLTTRWDTLTIFESPQNPHYNGRSVGDVARERGVTPWDALCDVSVEDKLETRIDVTFANDDVEGVTALLQGEGCILGLSDAGAHINAICDAVMPTDFLANWVRGRSIMPLEAGIRKVSGELADVLGIDRGYLRVGAPADLLVLDVDGLSPGPIRRVADMPADGERLVADAPAGIDYVFVNGVAIRENGRAVAERLRSLPGQIVSAP